MPDHCNESHHARSLYELMELHRWHHLLDTSPLSSIALSLRLGFAPADDNDAASSVTPTHCITIDHHAITAEGSADHFVHDIAQRAGLGGMIIVDIKLRGLRDHPQKYVSTDLTDRLFGMIHELNTRILMAERAADTELSRRLDVAQEQADHFLHDPFAVLDADDVLGTRATGPAPFPVVRLEMLTHELNRRRAHKERCRAFWQQS